MRKTSAVYKICINLQEAHRVFKKTFYVLPTLLTAIKFY